MGHGGRAPAMAGTGRISKGGGLMRMPGRRQHRGGNCLGGGGPSAQCPQGGCLPSQGDVKKEKRKKGDAPLAKRHREGMMCMRYGWLCTI